MNSPFKTLSARLAFWYSAFFVVFSGSALLIFYLSINKILHDDLDEDLTEDVMEMQLYLEEGGIDQLKNEIQREITTDDAEDIFIRLLDSNNNIIFSSDTRNWHSLPDRLNNLSEIHNGDDAIYDTYHHQDDTPARIITAKLDENIFIQIGESDENIDEFISLILNIFIITYVFVTILASLTGWFIARRALSGVEAVSNAAIDVSNGSIDRRVNIDPQGEEVKKLVTTFNLMLDRIRGLVTGMREMSDNIAHDIRGQLGRIRASAEMSLTGKMNLEEHKASSAEIIEECDRLIHLINTLLEVSEAEFGLSTLPDQHANLSEIINDAYELFEPIAEEKNIDLYSSIEPDCYFDGHIQHLQRMLANLLDNALKYTPEKGRIGIELTSDSTEVKIVIRDTGIGIKPEYHNRIFDRFFRCDASRTGNGNGLGLSFSRAVVTAHGGDINLVSEPGKGSVFSITLPKH